MILKSVNIAFLTQLVEYLLDGEPVFIIRAQDIASLGGIEGYIAETTRLGGGNQSRSTSCLVKFRNWQVEHPNRMKKAD